MSETENNLNPESVGFDTDYVSPELANKTAAYPMQQVKMIGGQLEKVADIATGGERKRRFGLALSIAVVPNLDQMPDQLTLNSDLPSLFFDADNMEDLRERVVTEITAILDLTEKQLIAAEKNEAASVSQETETVTSTQ